MLQVGVVLLRGKASEKQDREKKKKKRKRPWYKLSVVLAIWNP
jgi:hypothetical protein